MRKLLLFCFLLFGLNLAAEAQVTLETDTLKNVPYVCQADSFTVTVSGMHYMSGHLLDSAVHSFQNDSLLLRLYYRWNAGFAVLSPFQLPLRFQTPAPGSYAILSKRYTNNNLVSEGVSQIGICSPVSGTQKQLPTKITATIFPNPAQNILLIGTTSDSRLLAASLTDLRGQEMINLRFKNSTREQLHVENLKPGIYLLHLETEKGKTVKRIVKQ